MKAQKLNRRCPNRPVRFLERGTIDLIMENTKITPKEPKPITPTEAGLSLKVVSGPVGTVEGTWKRISYVVALAHEGREIWRGDYHLGIGHVDLKKVGDAWSYKNFYLTESERSMLHTWQKDPGVKFLDLEKHARLAAKLAALQKVEPELDDVCHSLLSDGAAHFDSLTFEEWARELGYDPDSRKAEKVFNSCVGEGRALARAIRREKLDGLREWACDY